MLGRIVALTAGSHSLIRYSLTDALVGAVVGLLLDRDEELVHRRLALLLRGEAGLGLAAALLGLLQLAAALRAALLGPALDPEALVAVLAALRCREADVDDVLPGAGALLAAVTDVARLVDPAGWAWPWPGSSGVYQTVYANGEVHCPELLVRGIRGGVAGTRHTGACPFLCSQEPKGGGTLGPLLSRASW